MRCTSGHNIPDSEGNCLIADCDSEPHYPDFNTRSLETGEECVLCRHAIQLSDRDVIHGRDGIVWHSMCAT